MKDCIYCEIANGQKSLHKIYEDDFVVAFLSESADCYGHTIVTSKKHYESMKTCDGQTLSRLIDACKKIGNHYCEDCGFVGYEVLASAGKQIENPPHVAFHILPRREGEQSFVEVKKQGIETDLEEVCKSLKLESAKACKLDDENYVVLYTDGACSGNPGAGGWAAILSFKGNEKVLSGGEEMTTNNRMELMAVIMGLESIKAGQAVKVFSDSAYVVNAFNQNWIEGWQRNNWQTSGKSEVLNKELWQRLLSAMKPLTVEFVKVKGHSDNVYNNRCDALAREEIAKLNK